MRHTVIGIFRLLLARRLPVWFIVSVAVLTVMAAGMWQPTFGEHQSYLSPSVSMTDAAVTDAGRSRQVATFATQWKADVDPILTLRDGRQAKASAYHGVLIGGQRYYYHVAGHVSLDPLGRGDVSFDQIVVKERIVVDHGFTVVVYTIPK